MIEPTDADKAAAGMIRRKVVYDDLEIYEHDEFIKVASSLIAIQLAPERAEAAKVRAERDQQVDDPELDATDAAHPAWWRGHEHAVGALCRKLREILDGNDDSSGVSSDPWESIRKRLGELVKVRAERDVIQKQFAEADAEVLRLESLLNKRREQR